MSGQLQTVHVRVSEGTNPTPVLIRFTDTEGTYYPPFGRLKEPRLGLLPQAGGNVCHQGSSAAYIDGTCEIALPPGSLQIELFKGFEYSPVRQGTVLQQGKLALRFSIERLVNLRAHGWASGDVRAHDLSPHDAFLEARCEGLDTIQLLAYADCSSIEQSAVFNHTAFSGQKPLLQAPDCQLAVNTLNRHPTLGSVALLHAHRLIHPLSFGPPGLDDWALGDWCDQAHRKGGLVVWTEPEKLYAQQAQSVGGEALACLLLDRVDALEVTPGFGGLPVWYDLLNLGYRPSLVGASAKSSTLQRIGECRTYAAVDANSSFDLTSWIESVRKGASWATSGPLFTFQANDQLAGSTIGCEDGKPLRLVANILAERASDIFQILFNGEIVAERPFQAGTVELELAPSTSGWLASRAVCRDSGLVTAHTSAISVKLPRPQPIDKLAVKRLDSSLSAAKEYLESRSRHSSERQRDVLARTIENGRLAIARRAQR